MPDEPKPLTEPFAIPDTFVSGTSVERLDGQVRIVGWSDMMTERRLVARLILPAETARALVPALRKAAAKGEH